jgi:hypothetical protein
MRELWALNFLIRPARAQVKEAEGKKRKRKEREKG